MNSLTILLAALPVAFGHIGLWHPAALDFNGDGYSLVEPLYEMSEAQWWFHGNLDKASEALAAEPLDLPAGKSINVELSCRKENTSYGSSPTSNPCPGTDEISINSLHSGEGRFDASEISGCGLAIAYKSDFASVQPADFTVFSVNTDCVRTRDTSFDIPAAMPACPDGKCICAWFWQGKNSQNEMYMTGFACNVSGATGTKAVAKGKVPVNCAADTQSCVAGPKQPMYWANAEGGNVANWDSMAYESKPSYNDAWGFKNGAQDDIFGTDAAEAKTGSTTSAKASSAVTTPAPSATASEGEGEGEQMVSALPISESVPSPSFVATTLITRTRTKISRPTQPPSAGRQAAAPSCEWVGHCEGDVCAAHEDCDGDLACNGGTCGQPTYDE
ncbi:hypothetical protein EDC01DRAFT_222262 [Geopyxis carbonaria]|nr:hypothetical protein EDC01DRAFT_222262 [Geopyxis carbonaria]